MKPTKRYLALLSQRDGRLPHELILQVLDEQHAAGQVPVAAAVTLAPLIWTSNGQAGDGPKMCMHCDEQSDEPHELTVCIDNLRKDRDALHGEIGRLQFPEVAPVAAPPAQPVPDILRSLSPEEFAAIKPVDETKIRAALKRGADEVEAIRTGRAPARPAAAEPAFKQYRRKRIAEMRPVQLHETQDGTRLVGLSVSDEDRRNGSPRMGDMVARNPANHADTWLASAQHFTDNFELPEAEAAEPAVPVAEEPAGVEFLRQRFGQRIGDRRYAQMLNGEEARALLLKLLDLSRQRDAALSQVETLQAGKLEAERLAAALSVAAKKLEAQLRTAVDDCAFAVLGRDTANEQVEALAQELEATKLHHDKVIGHLSSKYDAACSETVSFSAALTASNKRAGANRLEAEIERKGHAATHVLLDAEKERAERLEAECRALREPNELAVGQPVITRATKTRATVRALERPVTYVLETYNGFETRHFRGGVDIDHGCYVCSVGPGHPCDESQPHPRENCAPANPAVAPPSVATGGQAIVVGSTWRNKHSLAEHKVRAIDLVNRHEFVQLEGVGPGGYSTYVFRSEFEHVADA